MLIPTVEGLRGGEREAEREREREREREHIHMYMYIQHIKKKTVVKLAEHTGFEPCSRVTSCDIGYVWWNSCITKKQYTCMQ